jgi:hypothetical protein
VAKLTSDWTLANPLISSFGALDTDADARKAMIALTRSGRVLAYGTEAPACSPGSRPRFHHDNANSGKYERDAGGSGQAMDVAVAGRTLTFTAPGDDLLCGTVDHYEVVSSNSLTGANFGEAEPVDASALEPVEAGGEQSFGLPRSARR